MRRFITACLIYLFSAVTLADLIIVDPSVFPPGTDISNLYGDVTLATAQGQMVIFGTEVEEPLHLISDLITPVFSTGTAFSHASGDTWSAGQCCGGDQVLRLDFSQPTAAVAVLFVPDDEDTGVLQIYDGRDRLIRETIFRSSEPFTLFLPTTRNRPIAFALATFGDTGRIMAISFDRR